MKSTTANPTERTALETTGAAAYGVRPPKYRLPDATRLGSVSLQVADLTRSLRYYQHVLGLRVIARSDVHATLAPNGDSTPLLELHERPGARPVSRRGRLGLYHFAILLPDRAALGRFIAHLGNLGERAGMSDHLVSEAVYLTDPDGLGIEVYADRPRSSWRTERQQLVMQTEPLDVAPLLQAAGSEPWTGMPAGTVLGHVHLFVSDLALAEAFFHAGLGFDKVVWSYPGALFLSAGGYHHHLGTNTWAGDAPRAGEDDARLLEWNIRVPAPSDVEAAECSLKESGYEVTMVVHDAVAVDPWGTRLRVSSTR